jgi:N-acetylgalactosamine-N,N'-diacetylbacillosaminyl-diphospho-undecaprenol 4-alpha-N-acetylgalactosaminyltransferase
MRNKQNLSILIYSLAGGGAERVVSVLLDELEDRYNVSLVLMRNKIDYDIPKGAEVYLLENSKPDESGVLKLLKLPYLGWRYKKFCQKNRIDVSLAFMNRPSYVAVFAKLFGLKCRNIISERTTPSMMYSDGTLQSKISKLLIQKLYPQADGVITNSEGNRIDLVENFRINHMNVETIYNPFDLERIEKLSMEDTQDVDFSRFTFITAGRLDSGKNHSLLIDVFAKLEEKNTQLLILGEGVLRDNLEKQIVALGLEDRVFLMGFDNNPYKYFSKSDTFVFTSNYEGFPNVLVEALACGLPIVSTDCKSGPREILAPYTDVGFQCKGESVEVAEYGLLTAIESQQGLLGAMERVLVHSELRQNYVQRAKVRARVFHKTDIVNAYVKILKG